MTVGRYLARRLLQAAVVLWAAFTVSFAVLYVLPGDPVAIMAGAGTQSSTTDPEQLAALSHQYGLDQPLVVQYWDKLVAALHGDLGRSVVNGSPVSTIIKQNLPATLQLTLLALAFAVLFGSTIALCATYTRARWLRQFLLTLPAAGVSLPSFWVGLMLLQLFSFRLHVFPAFGNNGVRSLVLPALTLAVASSAVIAQLLAKSMDNVLSEPYIETARAKGASRLRIHFRHALRNAAAPALTILGVTFGELITNAVITETVFSRTGLGSVTAQAVQAENIPVVQGVVIVSAVAFVLVNLAVDLVYPLLDPRIVTAGAAR